MVTHVSTFQTVSYPTSPFKPSTTTCVPGRAEKQFVPDDGPVIHQPEEPEREQLHYMLGSPTKGGLLSYLQPGRGVGAVCGFPVLWDLEVLFALSHIGG